MGIIKKDILIVIGASSKLFEEILKFSKFDNYEKIFISRKKTITNIKYKFIKWDIEQKFNLKLPHYNQINRIFLINFIHLWEIKDINFNSYLHLKLIRSIKYYESVLKKKFYKMFISSLSSLRSPSNNYGLIKKNLNKIYLNHGYLILNIGLIIGSERFFIYKELIKLSKKRIIFIPNSQEPLQIVHIKKISYTITKIMKNYSFFKPKNLYLCSQKKYTFKELLYTFNSSKKIIIQINLKLIIFVFYLLYKFKLIKYSKIDSLNGLKKRYYAHPKFNY